LGETYVEKDNVSEMGEEGVGKCCGTGRGNWIVLGNMGEEGEDWEKEGILGGLLEVIEGRTRNGGR
jgi:hypothetical protein